MRNTDSAIESVGRMSPAFRIPVIYGLIGLVWILLSDWLVHYVVADPSVRTYIQTYKGYGFVLVTAFLLSLLIRRDLRARRESSTAMLTGDQQYRRLIDLSPEAMAIHVDGRIVHTNQVAVKLAGCESVAEMTGMLFTDFLKPEDRSIALERAGRANRQGAPLQPKEYELLTRGGRSAWVEVINLPVTYRGGRAGLSYLHDITDRIRAREALQASEERYRAMVENQVDAICRWRPDGTLTFVNESYCRTVGKARASLLGRPWYLLIPAAARDDVQGFYMSLAEQPRIVTCEREVAGADGESRWMRWTDCPIFDAEGQLVEFQSVGSDVTDARRAEEALQKSEEMLRLFFEHAYDGVNVAEYESKTHKRRLVSCNDKYVEMSGRSREELMATENLNDLVEYPHTWEERRGWARSIEQGVPFRGRGSWKRPDGRENHYEWTAAPIHRDDKVLIVGIDRDITEQRKAEEALRLTQFSIDHASVAAFWIAPDAEVLYANETAGQYLGYPRGALSGMRMYDIEADSDAAKWPGRWAELRAQTPALQELTHRAFGGRLVPVELAANYLEFGGSEYVVAFVRDITERVRAQEERERLEQQLWQAQKLEALGNLAGGVAHDFNNLLTGIIGYANLLKMDADPGAEPFQSAEAIEQAARRGGQLTSQLLAFARKRRRENVALDLHETIGDVGNLLRRTLGEHIVVTQDLAAEHCVIRGDGAAVQQVVLNLAFNARDAMPEGGQLQLATREVNLDEADPLLQDGLAPGSYIVLTVSDTGVGVPEDIRDRIFEPFFTTKEPGKGTGMGLAMAYGTVRDHGGAIRFESETGCGTTFSIYLPLVEGVAPSRTEARPSEAVRGTGRILLVDDEEVVRDSVSQMLGGLGYEVVTASDGPTAVSYYQQHASEIDVVIIDMVMPRMSGVNCYHALKAMNPDLRAVLSTGYGLNGQAEQLLNEGQVELVEKPYGLLGLSEAIARVLHR